MKQREWTILAIVGAIVIVVCYTVSQLTTSSGSSGGTTLSDVFKELIDNVGFLALIVILILALVFLPVGL